MTLTGSEEFTVFFSQPHNTINRLTQTTGTGQFAPFAEEGTYYYPETELALFVLLDEEVTDIARTVRALQAIGRYGYGKNASSGQGRFEVGDYSELTLPDSSGAKACYTLAPSIPEKKSYSHVYFRTFVRFGKHGDRLARSSNPFKNPVIMLDEGAVLIPEGSCLSRKPYLGTAIAGVSKSLPESVVQGYAPLLPFKLES